MAIFPVHKPRGTRQRPAQCGHHPLHVPLFNVYQFSLLVGFAAVGAVLQSAVEGLAGARGAQQGRVRILTERLGLVHLVVRLRPVLELEDYQDDQDYRYQRGGYDADYEGGVLGRLGRDPLIVVVLGRSGHRRIRRRRRRRRRLRHFRRGRLRRHGCRPMRHDAAAKRPFSFNCHSDRIYGRAVVSFRSPRADGCCATYVGNVFLISDNRIRAMEI